MTSSSSAGYSDILQTTQPGQEAQYSDLLQTTQSGQGVEDAIEKLRQYFDVAAIPAEEGCRKVVCLYDESKALKEVREEFRKEFLQSTAILDVVKEIVQLPGKKYYLSRAVRLLVFQSGWSQLNTLVAKDDCVILIPDVISGSGVATIHDPTTQRQTTFEFKKGFEFIITGRCAIWLEQQSKVVCVVLCIGKEKG